MSKHTIDELRTLQALPLELKIEKSKNRIKEAVERYGEDGVYVSFSGGKDSTVLLDLTRSIFPNVKGVFSDTGLEFPEIRAFVFAQENIEVIKPKMTFKEIVSKYGYPLFSKEVSHAIWYARKIRTTDNGRPRGQRQKLLGELTLTKSCSKFRDDFQGEKTSMFNKQKYLPACQKLPYLIGDNCCQVMKKQPFASYSKRTGRVPIVGTLAEESMLRTQGWVKNGCNAFETDKPKSAPLSFWTEQDVLQYIQKKNLPIASVYGELVFEGLDGFNYTQTLFECGKLKCSGASRTGCMYCAYGAGNEAKRLGKSRFQLLKELHPKIYDYVMRGGEWADNPYYDPAAPTVDPVDGWLNWNPAKIWVPSNDGLGMKFVFDEANKIYGEDYIKY